MATTPSNRGGHRNNAGRRPNCKMLKDILSQLPTEGFTPFFTTITTVRDGQRKYYKFT